MKRNIVAIILVFALLLSFAACRKLDSENILVESKAYIVDDEGVTRDIYNVGSNYYYYDADGNRKEANKKDVVVETNKVVITEPASLSPEAQSFMDSFGDVDSIEDMMEADATVPELENDKLIPEDAFNDIEVEVDADGKPVHEDIPVSFDELVASEKFTVEAKIKTTTDGLNYSAPMNIMRNGSKLYFETAVPLENGLGSTRVNLLFLDDACYIIIPSMRAYMAIPKETAGDMIPSDAFSDLNNAEGEYVSSGEVVHDGQTYICDVFETEDGVVTKNYYQNGQLKRVETVSGTTTSIMEFTKLSTSVDESKFNVPKNYFDMSQMGGDYVSSMLGS